jgi:curved DNA-binding protein CbpA
MKISQDFNPYQTLGFKQDSEIPLSVIKKRFYQLSIKYHPDKINTLSDGSSRATHTQEIPKYQEIIIAYNILRDEKLRKDYHQQYPANHYQLKHLPRKMKYKLSKKKYRVPENFNLEFLQSISKRDQDNIDMYINLGFNQSDIDDQFRVLHPETKFDSNYTCHMQEYSDFQKEINKLVEKRRLQDNVIQPVKIIDKYNADIFHQQFLINKRNSQIIKYREPLPFNKLFNQYMYNDPEFSQEYVLPDNPSMISEETFSLVKDYNQAPSQSVLEHKLQELLKSREEMLTKI